jgi:hypothetical protein
LGTFVEIHFLRESGWIFVSPPNLQNIWQSFCRSWILLWTYLVAGTNLPLRTKKAIWEGGA